MTIKINQATAILNVVNKVVNNSQLPPMLVFLLAQNAQILAQCPKVAAAEQLRHKLITELGKPDTQNPSLITLGSSPEAIATFTEKFMPVGEQEVDLDFEPLTREDFKDCSIGTFTIADMITLQPLLQTKAISPEPKG